MTMTSNFLLFCSSICHLIASDIYALYFGTIIELNKMISENLALFSKQIRNTSRVQISVDK